MNNRFKKTIKSDATHQNSPFRGLGGNMDFLLKGLLRDRSRSLLPIIVVSLGVMISVFMHAYMGGAFGDSIEKTANFETGHIRVMTRAYSENRSQMPNDLALVGVDSLKQSLIHNYPGLNWTERIEFGGMLDVPDSSGQTRVQGNVMGRGVDLLSPENEIGRLELEPMLIKGRFPKKPGEILVSDELFDKMKLKLGEKVTLMSSTMYGEMAMYNFEVAGTLRFGVNMLDRGMMIADVHDVQNALNMEDAASSILGFFKNKQYNDKQAVKIAKAYDAQLEQNKDPFAPVMSSLSENGLMGISYNFIQNLSGLIIFIFIFAMSIVLWNAGLISGLRRYGEFGLRMAIGENKREIYRSLIWEALLIGIIGTLIGTAVGLLLSWFMQIHGINMGGLMKNSTLMFSNVLRAKITPTTWFIGFVPGIVSTVIGAMLAGIGIYKRQTANLFKELEN